MCKDAGLPVVWNVHAKLPRDMKGPLFLLSHLQPDSVDALFSKLREALMGVGVAEEHISLEATEPAFPFAFNHITFKKLLTEVHLLVPVVMQPPSSPAMQPPPPLPPVNYQPYLQLPFAHAMPVPQAQSPLQPHPPPHPPPLMQSPPQHFVPLTPPRPPSAASSTSAPSPTPTVLAIEGRVSALETQLRSVDAKLDRLLAFMAPAEAPPAQRQRTS
jgi:hypothetical protein